MSMSFSIQVMSVKAEGIQKERERERIGSEKRVKRGKRRAQEK